MTKDKYNDYNPLLRDALDEIILYLHDDIDNPVSLSFYCYSLGVRDKDIKSKLIRKAFDILSHSKNLDEMKIDDFKRGFEEESKHLDSNMTAAYILSWFIQNRILPQYHDTMRALLPYRIAFAEDQIDGSEKID